MKQDLLDPTLTKSEMKIWTSRAYKKQINKRKRKSANQLQVLFQEFQNSADWDKDIMAKISENTGLTEGQIYKWSWDQKKKFHYLERVKMPKNIHLCEIFDALPEMEKKFSSKTQPAIRSNVLSCVETICPRVIDIDFYQIQRDYRAKFDSLKTMDL